MTQKFLIDIISQIKNASLNQGQARILKVRYTALNYAILKALIQDKFVNEAHFLVAEPLKKEYSLLKQKKIQNKTQFYESFNFSKKNKNFYTKTLKKEYAFLFPLENVNLSEKTNLNFFDKNKSNLFGKNGERKVFIFFQLSKDERNQPFLKKIEIISKPSLRIYSTVYQIKEQIKKKQQSGKHLYFSTSYKDKQILNAPEAVEYNVGGEFLFQIN
uniref:ribosomal protein S8 n=1 Tax=Prototheca moriformis TaxID=183676 RepID=UPI003001BC5B